MTLAWLREAALVAAHAHQESESSTKDVAKPTRLDLSSQKQFPHVSWQRIDDIGGGLFICGAAALDNKAELSRLGIGCILNCGGEDIYTRSYNCADGTPLSKRLQGFHVEVLDAEDVEQQDMRAAWQKAAGIIDEALRRGDGVVVHCAQGVSRSSSTCIAYLMMKENLPLEGAFRRVFQATLRELPWSVWMQSLPKGGVTWQLDGSETLWHGEDEVLQSKAAEHRAFAQTTCFVNVVYKHNWIPSFPPLKEMGSDLSSVTVAGKGGLQVSSGVGTGSGPVALAQRALQVNSAGPTRWRLELGAQGELPALPGDRDGVLRIACGDVVLAVLAAGSVPTLWGSPRLVVRDELGEELVLEGDDRGPTADWVAEWLPERPGPYEVFVLYPGVGENEEMLDVAAPTWQLVAAGTGRDWSGGASFAPLCPHLSHLEFEKVELKCWQEASKGSTSRVAPSPDRSMGVVIADVFVEEVVQLTVLSRLAGPIERWPETLEPQHDELYSHIMRRRGGLQAKTSAEVRESAGAAAHFPYTEGGFCSSPAAVYWAWFQLAIGQRLAAAATASKISVSDVLADPSAAGIIRFAEKLGRPLSACEKAHLAAIPVSRSWLQEALR
ncbi:Dusp26 [Symbiodinium sp. CCMP2592]|nr:Dusp26 [Symbiodinium sp. CCMP2592]